MPSLPDLEPFADLEFDLHFVGLGFEVGAPDGAKETDGSKDGVPLLQVSLWRMVRASAHEIDGDGAVKGMSLGWLDGSLDSEG